MGRLAALTLLVAGIAVAVPLSAVAGERIDRAVAGLRDDPVYVDADATVVGTRDVDRLREAIEGAGGSIYVAVFPSEALREGGGSPEQVLGMVAEGVGRPGTYAIVAGTRFRTGATRGDLGRGVVPRLAREAFAARRADGVAATLLDFVDRVGEARRGDEREAEGGGSRGFGGIVLALVLAALGWLGFRRFQQRRRQDEELAAARRAAQEDLLALADDIRSLDLDVEMPNVDQRARDFYGRAVTCYDRADRELDAARRPGDLESVTAALEKGRFAMAAAKAVLAGGEPPERRPPCFFDPRHGPSVRDVAWTPPFGEERPVPACAACALRVDEGLEPEAREVLVGGRRVPYWEAGPAFAPWAGGYFGGLLPGLLLGSMLGGMMFAPVAYGGEPDAGGDFGGGDLGGDFDAGDFDAGDFGGGDFGGGDFGGDAGGGDF